jgi:hypothetical protein
MTGMMPSARVLLDAGFVGRELIDRTAELAGHDHFAVLDHLGAVFGRKAS